jgi:hypothetical protein
MVTGSILPFFIPHLIMIGPGLIITSGKEILEIVTKGGGPLTDEK